MDYTERRRRCEDVALRELKMLALKTGVTCPKPSNSVRHQKVEEPRGRFSPRASGGSAPQLTT